MRLALEYRYRVIKATFAAGVPGVRDEVAAGAGAIEVDCDDVNGDAA